MESSETRKWWDGMTVRERGNVVRANAEALPAKVAYIDYEGLHPTHLKAVTKVRKSNNRRRSWMDRLEEEEGGI